jgi:hypothetical protein
MAADYEPALIKADPIVDRVLLRQSYRMGLRLNRGSGVGTYDKIGQI